MDTLPVLKDLMWAFCSRSVHIIFLTGDDTVFLVKGPPGYSIDTSITSLGFFEHDGPSIRPQHKLDKLLLWFVAENLKTEEVLKFVGLEILNHLVKEVRLDVCHIGRRSLAILSLQ